MHRAPGRILRWHAARRQRHAPLLLSDTGGLHSDAQSWLSGHHGTLRALTVFGGPSAVGQAIVTEVGNSTWGGAHWNYFAMP